MLTTMANRRARSPSKRRLNACKQTMRTGNSPRAARREFLSRPARPRLSGDARPVRHRCKPGAGCAAPPAAVPAGGALLLRCVAPRRLARASCWRPHRQQTICRTSAARHEFAQAETISLANDMLNSSAPQQRALPRRRVADIRLIFSLGVAAFRCSLRALRHPALEVQLHEAHGLALSTRGQVLRPVARREEEGQQQAQQRDERTQEHHLLDAVVRRRRPRDVRHDAGAEEGAGLPGRRRDAVQRRLRLRREDLARDDVRRQIRPEVGEEERQAVDRQEEQRRVGPQGLVGQAADAEPQDHVRVADDLHVLPPQAVDQRHADEVAWQHDEHDDERREALPLEAIVADVDDGGDVGVKQAVGVEDDVEEEPVPRGAQQVPSVAPDRRPHVNAGAAILARLLHLVEGLALVHLHPEVQRDHGHDGPEGQGEAPSELRRGAGEGQRDHDEGREKIPEALVGEHERHQRPPAARRRALGTDRRGQRVLAPDAEAEQAAADHELREEALGAQAELLHASGEDGAHDDQRPGRDEDHPAAEPIRERAEEQLADHSAEQRRRRGHALEGRHVRIVEAVGTSGVGARELLGQNMLDSADDVQVIPIREEAASRDEHAAPLGVGHTTHDKVVPGAAAAAAA
eukprot:CAMPEP_0176196330 /NCGR_PEP_ID=MMETSP0121_2-20121125/6971_1 /TAXON_ID=160619 /ORGANISM="Kryptoperidinium foliaceum, Strain CCMP 1326" /LENGTH=632 /DNA_ID=CAMNT_0017535125 /DNA_START=1 /DNA_END=1897 /DNA_ORIENTATION=+